MTYQVEFTRKASKQLAKLPENVQQRIKIKVEEIAENPRPSGVVKLENSNNRYRIRVGDYRVLYEIIDDLLIVTVVKIGHRREVYQDE
ncbi:plasmid stabilization system [Tolypothrix tenuis PCC 7101]|uniref:Plasmid stabilization system n=1 Tax=Tolypothrix tenuis PCC 7101 TaxID=231146 RepID=A0A1Z4MRN7_9CYAN|nr:type II toxin-antitoxin system RelE/ParE family toxin [Aulosira sp. FACHB-113]BAY96112.1 plasmid stabilization system [Tolypothrix tenuis PCC 7101]BAZ73381.1 plasmid stabilization system [Aulosira laxa NIES-50]